MYMNLKSMSPNFLLSHPNLSSKNLNPNPNLVLPRVS